MKLATDLTLFRPPMFLVGGTRRWKKKNSIFLRETRTFTGNFIVSREYWHPDSIGNRTIIYSAIKWHFDWMDNPAIICCLAQNVGRLVFPYLRPTPSRMQSNNVGIYYRESGSKCRAIWFTILSVCISFLWLPIVKNKCLKAAGKSSLEVMSFVTCQGSKCSHYNDVSSPLLIGEIIHGA